MEDRKPSHNKVAAAARAFRDGSGSRDELFSELAMFLHDHLHNLGLSERAIRYWLSERSPKEWRVVRAEFLRPEVEAGLARTMYWVGTVARSTRAFRLRCNEGFLGSNREKRPLLKWIMWRYYYRDLEPERVPEFELPVRDDGGRIVFRPWV